MRTVSSFSAKSHGKSPLFAETTGADEGTMLRMQAPRRLRRSHPRPCKPSHTARAAP